MLLTIMNIYESFYLLFIILKTFFFHFYLIIYLNKNIICMNEKKYLKDLIQNIKLYI